MAAKIYRINYKSDFILTLTSDAGWTTPFCIKFWTGAPAMAYYAGWDGTTYTHCAYDPAEPTKLQVQFDDHHLPVGDLKFQIGYHFIVADFPNDTEDEVINSANITVEVNGEAYQVMLDFTGETAPEIEFALPAYANEQQRIANEQQRIVNEQQRIEAEDQRVTDFGVIEQQAQQAISDAGSAAQAAYEAAGEAANVNAELDGTILTITNRQGTSTSVNTKGDQGEQGNPGQAATISVGTTTTGAPGTSAQVTNSGTSSAAVLDFTIPQGAKGDKGDQGEPGEVTEAELTEKLAAKANTDGYYSRMIVGGAESLIGDVPQTATYTFRRTGGGAIGEPVARLTEVQGNTGVVNQLVGSDNLRPTATVNGITFTNSGDKFVVDGTATARVSAFLYRAFTQINGHKYFCICSLPDATVSASTSSGFGTFTSAGAIIDCTMDANNQTFNVVVEQGTSYANKDLIINISDLTLEYGTGNEPGTVAEFEARIWRDYGKTLDEYIAYTQGKLINCKAVALESVGQNQWDEEWELGTWGYGLGEVVRVPSSTQVRNKNLIPVSPSTTYCITNISGDTSGYFVVGINNADTLSGSKLQSRVAGQTQVFTTNVETHYIGFSMAASYGTTYKNDICINISDAALNGTYRPYKKDVVNLNLTTLTGINPTTGVREVIFPNGMGGGEGWRSALRVVNGAVVAVKNSVRVNMGSLTYRVLSTTYYTFGADITDRAWTKNIMCSGYAIDRSNTQGTQKDLSVRGATDATTIILKDSRYTHDATGIAQLKAAMDGVYLEYQLAEPIIYTDIQYADGTPFVLPTNFEVQNDGTERITHTEGEDSIAPVMSAIYGLNAVGFVQDAPKDYTSQATLDGLIAKISAITGTTITKTWDAANNKWVFS